MTELALRHMPTGFSYGGISSWNDNFRGMLSTVHYNWNDLEARVSHEEAAIILTGAIRRAARFVDTIQSMEGGWAGHAVWECSRDRVEIKVTIRALEQLDITG